MTYIKKSVSMFFHAAATLCLILTLMLLVPLLGARESFRTKPSPHTTVVGIVGNPCAGKTRLATMLQTFLTQRGYRVHTLSQDRVAPFSHVGILTKTKMLCQAFLTKVRHACQHNAPHDFLIVDGATLNRRCGMDSLNSMLHVLVYLHYDPKQCSKDRRRKWYDPKLFGGMVFDRVYGTQAPTQLSNAPVHVIHHHVAPGRPDTSALDAHVLRNILAAHHA